MNLYDQFDVTLEDDDLMSEVVLMTDLICAASEFERNLTKHEIDRILDVVHCRAALSGLRPAESVAAHSTHPAQ